MFRYPVKFDQYLQDLQKSIDYILKIVRKPKVDKVRKVFKDKLKKNNATYITI